MALENSPASWTERAAAACGLEAVGWTAEGQAERFEAVLTALNPQPGETLLDYGCGLGALVESLTDETVYTGYDWAPGMLRRAAKEHPGREFTRVLDEAREFDLIACVGTFNLPRNWSKAQTWETLRQLWGVCRSAMAVSLYAGTDKRCLRYEPGQAIAFAQTAERWRVARYRSNDLLMVLYR